MPRRIAIVPLILLLALSACGQTAPASTGALHTPTPAPAPSQTPAPGGAAVDVTDAAGRRVTIPAPPETIVSLAPSTTEILFALGLGQRVVATDDLSNYPPEAASLPKIGGYGGVNYEQIAALEPGLVLAAGITPPEQVQKIEELGLPVLVVGQPESSVASVYDDIALVGRATGTADAADALVADAKARIAAVSEAVAGRESPAVFWELDATDPSKPYTVGPGSFIGELLALAGGRNIFGSADTPYPQVSAEQVVAADPQVILLADAQYGVAPEQVGQRPGWEDIAAVTGGAVYPVDADLTSRPGPRIAEAVESIARLLHPDAVK